MPILSPTILDASTPVLPVLGLDAIAFSPAAVSGDLLGFPLLAAAAIHLNVLVVNEQSGTYRVVAGQVFVPGARIGELFSPGSLAGQVFVPGAKKGSIV